MGLRVVERKDGNDWTVVSMSELRKGDSFRMFEDAEKTEPAGDPEMVALSDPSRSDFWPDGRMSIAVSCDDVCEPIHEVS